MHVNSIHLGQVALARSFAAQAQSGSRQRRKEARRLAALRFLDELRAGVPGGNRADARLSDATSFAECPGRPHVSGAGTFLAMSYLRRLLRGERDC